MNDTYASHVLRIYLLLLSGSDLGSDVKSKRSKKYKSNHKISKISVGSRKVSDKFLDILHQITKSIMKSLKLNQDIVKELAFNQNANPVLQILLKNEKFSQSMVKLLVKNADVEFLNQLIHDSVGSHLMEKVLGVVSTDLYKSLYRMVFKNHLIELAEHPVANFVVQRLIEFVPREKTLLKIIKELSPCFSSFIHQNRIGLLSMIAKACLPWENLQEIFMNHLVQSLGADIPTQSLIFQVLFNSNTYVEYRKPNLQGSLLVQHLVKYKSTLVTVILNGIYSLDPTSLKKWAVDPILSRIISSFLESNLLFKMKKKLVLSFRGSLSYLAKDRIGSRVLDQLWLVSDIHTRELFLKELLESEVELLNDFYGKFILSKAHWDLYKKRRDEWMTLSMRVENRKSLFAEFTK
jgi:nucleolar protein 9